MGRLKNITKLWCAWDILVARAVLRVVLIAPLFFCANLHAAPATVDLTAETSYSDNLAVTSDRMFEPVGGMHSLVSANLRKTTVLSERLSVLGEVGLGYHQFHIDQPADYWSVNAAIAANYRPFTGFTSPYFKFSLSARRNEYRNEFHPDWAHKSKFSINKQWSSTVLTSIGMAAREGYDEWPVVDTVNFGYWDTSQRELFVAMDVRFSRFIAYGQLSRTEGDLIWTLSQGENYVGLLWSDDARTDQLKLGVNFPVSSNAALDILGSFSRVSFQGNKTHDEFALSLAYIHRFSL